MWAWEQAAAQLLALPRNTHAHEREVEQKHGRFPGDERRGDKLACMLALFFIHRTWKFCREEYRGYI
jgi:hypothetical protein